MAEPDPVDQDVDQEDETRRKFREALERKNASHTEMHAEGNPNKGVREARNDKQQREFRRKSG
jgi:Family of unknown function (DUF5302)